MRGSFPTHPDVRDVRNVKVRRGDLVAFNKSGEVHLGVVSVAEVTDLRRSEYSAGYYAVYDIRVRAEGATKDSKIQRPTSLLVIEGAPSPDP